MTSRAPALPSILVLLAAFGLYGWTRGDRERRAAWGTVLFAILLIGAGLLAAWAIVATGWASVSPARSGLLYPDEFGGRNEFEAVRATQLAATPVMMVGWSGSGTRARIYGLVVILAVRDQQTSINADGFGRRVSYEIEVAPSGGGGKPIGLFG